MVEWNYCETKILTTLFLSVTTCIFKMCFYYVNLVSDTVTLNNGFSSKDLAHVTYFHGIKGLFLVAFSYVLLQVEQ